MEVESYPINPDICKTCKFRHADQTPVVSDYTCNYISIMKHSRPKTNSSWDHCEAYEEGEAIKRRAYS